MIVIHTTDNKGNRSFWAIKNDGQSIVLNTLCEHMKFNNISDCFWLVPGTVDFSAD